MPEEDATMLDWVVVSVLTFDVVVVGRVRRLLVAPLQRFVVIA